MGISSDHLEASLNEAAGSWVGEVSHHTSLSTVPALVPHILSLLSLMKFSNEPGYLRVPWSPITGPNLPSTRTYALRGEGPCLSSLPDVYAN